jgi:hypothetical protein
MRVADAYEVRIIVDQPKSDERIIVLCPHVGESILKAVKAAIEDDRITPESTFIQISTCDSYVVS